MVLTCPRCGREHAVTAGGPDPALFCECGEVLFTVRLDEGGGPPHEEAAEELRRGADRIVNLILHGDLPDVDVEIEIANLRRRCAEILPDRVDLFDKIYVSRFRRLKEQFPKED
ncbi:MAG: hypothetical protein ABIH26_13340 [Candidatus Eisenbacteria bacterium]